MPSRSLFGLLPFYAQTISIEKTKIPSIASTGISKIELTGPPFPILSLYDFIKKLPRTIIIVNGSNYEKFNIVNNFGRYLMWDFCLIRDLIWKEKCC